MKYTDKFLTEKLSYVVFVFFFSPLHIYIVRNVKGEKKREINNMFSKHWT